MLKFLKYIALIIILINTSNLTWSARIKDVATIEGISGLQVVGYGLVIGLNNTGDNQRSTFTVQSVSNMLLRFGIRVPQTDPRIRNVAAVMVTSTIPPFLKKGSKVDVSVASIGDARSLQGGVLVLTPMSLPNGTIVGYAQGPMSVGGYNFESLGSRVGRNFVTSGRIPNGLILETAVNPSDYPNGLSQIAQINVVLRDPDFTTANNIASAVRSVGGVANATAIDQATIRIQLNPGQDQIAIISAIEAVNIQGDPVARVVINERTGTIVVGGNVQLLPSVISHGGLEIQIQRNVIVPQPAPFTIRPPSPVETAEINVEEEINPPVGLEIPEGATVADMANALNALNVKPRDLISIFQALKESGSLQGELIIQ